MASSTISQTRARPRCRITRTFASLSPSNVATSCVDSPSTSRSVTTACWGSPRVSIARAPHSGVPCCRVVCRSPSVNGTGGSLQKPPWSKRCAETLGPALVWVDGNRSMLFHARRARTIDADPKEPGLEGTAPFESLDAFDHRDPRVLGHVLGTGGVGDVVARDLDQRPVISPHQFVEGRFIAREETFQELGVVHVKNSTRR